MRRIQVTSAVALLLGMAYTAAFAAVAQEAPSKPAAPEMVVLKTDLRLSRKITYFTKIKPLRLILDELSKASGVTLKAGYNNADWQVRDRRMNIFLKDVTLNEAMQSIARVMKFKWTRSDPGENPSYRLIMDRKETIEAEKLRSQAYQRFQHEVLNRREKALEEMDRIANLPPDELEKLRKDKPALYLYATTGEAGFLAALAKENATAREAIMSGRGAVVPVSELSEDGRAALLEGVKGMWFLATTGSDRHWQPMPDRAINELPNGIIRIVDPGLPSTSSLSFLAKMEILWGNDRLVTYLPNGADPVQNAYAVGTLRCREENVAGVDMWPRPEYKTMFQEAYAGLEADTEQFYPGEPKIEHEDEPWMHDKLTRKVEGRLSDALEALAERAEFSVVSDCFNGSNYPGASFEKDSELKTILTAAEARRYNWTQHGSTLEFRDRNWFKRRELQIPDDWMDGWAVRLKTNGFLDLPDLAQIARLHEQQLYDNFPVHKVLGEDSLLASLKATMHPFRDLLRFYSTLTPLQRDILFVSGLPADSLSDDQADFLLVLLFKKPALLQEAASDIVFSCKKVSQTSGTEYKFKAISRNDETLFHEWNVVPPKYVPPAKKPEPDSATKVKQPIR